MPPSTNRLEIVPSVPTTVVSHVHHPTSGRGSASASKTPRTSPGKRKYANTSSPPRADRLTVSALSPATMGRPLQVTSAHVWRPEEELQTEMGPGTIRSSPRRGDRTCPAVDCHRRADLPLPPWPSWSERWDLLDVPCRA